ncbi:phosphoribosyltransferase [Paenibacillus xylanexedens]|uniref:phosphoribosyltransferase n=1 Tax=Paenibacillus xylanexedens TaxID=528191 RepID=UPI000F5491DB|nr:phosphoribosyltransferase family protein [Paenibacillus xylanexedens]RPK27811.1 Xanthine-guanine phosphoribosyltransferase [Paenibacillus xylanexedens]
MIYEMKVEDQCYVMSWEEYDQAIQMLASKLEEQSFYPDVIIGVFQGGWIVGQSLLDHFRRARMVGCQVNYNEEVLSPFYTVTDERKGGFPELIENKQILLIDEVIDSGKTLSFFMGDLLKLNSGNVKIASFFYFSNSQIIPNFSIKKLEEPLNIVFPWRYNRDMDTILYAVLQHQWLMIDEIQRLIQAKFNIQYSILSIEEGVARLHIQGLIVKDHHSVMKKLKMED